jgi:small GTP-binding protein
LSSDHRRQQLWWLNLRGNPGIADLLPKEALETGDAQAILAAYLRFETAHRTRMLRLLNELKLLVVGNEAVGKTSLLRALIHDTPRDPVEAKTPGIVQHEKIEIAAWSPKGSQVQLNVWDFGGQEMLRGTHRFFLTERSLYLLVLEDRRQDDKSIYELMKTIRNRAGDSPVLVVINKSDAGKQDLQLPETELQQRFPNIAGFLRSSCNDDDWGRSSIVALRRRIVDLVATDGRLQHVRLPIPANWLSIKQRVSEAASRNSVLTHREFVDFCRSRDVEDEPVVDDDEQRALLRVLHELGTIVAYGLVQDAPAVHREISLLDPNWLTDAIYRILEKSGSVEQEGEFARRQLHDWLDPGRYPVARHEFILTMMQAPEIGLCFRLPGPGDERYLVPEALSPNKRYVGNWPANCLRFRYRYGYLPPGLVPRLIVQAHRNLIEEKARWKTGVVLHVRDCPVLILADREKNELDLQIDGPEGLRRSALNVILDDLEIVHQLNPEAEPVALVPLPDRPHEHVRYEHLLALEARYGLDHAYLPEGASREYSVSELLSGVRRDARAPDPRAPYRPHDRPDYQQRSVEDRATDTTPHVVVLIHGIRTRALWQAEIGRVLESAGFTCQPTNYGYFDLFRFLCPWQIFADPVIDDITRQIRHSMKNGAPCSIIAHSFGSFVFSRILRRSELDFQRVILCGSVVPHHFRFEDYSSRFAEPIVNEVGTRDVWPVLAETVTFGYGSAGTYGFRRPTVRDRWHNGKAHGDFLTREFCRKYWLPFLRDGTIADNQQQPETPPSWVQLVSVIQPRYLIPVGLMVLALWHWQVLAMVF